MSDRQGISRSGEVDLRVGDIIWTILSHWRRILLISLAAALLAGGYTGVRQGLKLRDKSYVAAAKEKNAALKEAYSQDKDRLNALKEHLRSQIQFQADFADNSPMFQINPYAAHTMTLIYYAAAEGAGDELSLLAQDLSIPVLNAYRARIGQIDLMGLMFPDDQSQPAAGEFDLGGSLMTALVDPEAHTLELTIVGPGPEHLASVSAAIDKVIADSEAEITAEVAPHKIAKLSETTAIVQNDNLIRIHTDYEKRMDTLMDKYTDVTTELTKLKSPSLATVRMSQVLRSAVKKAVLGGGLTFFAALACAFIIIALRGRILSAGDMLDFLPVSYLGSVNGDPGTAGAAGKLDRLIRSRLGLIPGRTREEEADFIAANIQRSPGSAGSAALIGSADKALLEELARDLSACAGGLRVVSGGDVLSDAAAVRAYGECGAVILVETAGRSRRADLISTRNMIRGDGKKILGAILAGTK